MPLRITVHDSTEPTSVEDRSQLEAVLQTASEEARRENMLGGVFIEAENGNFMTMVVGGGETVLSFAYAHLNPPSYASKGASNEIEPILTCFLNFQHHTEFPRKNVIPYDDGAKAVAQFLDSGKLPTCISWEEV